MVPSDDPTPPPVNPDPYPRPEAPVAGSLDNLIPAKNPPALIGYYLGLFSILPLLGLPMAVAGIWLGAKGFKAIKQQPGLPGKAHASVGLGCGLIGLLINLGILAVIIAAAMRVPPGS